MMSAHETSALIARGDAAWPGVALDPTVFHHLDWCAQLPPERYADAYLALGCAQGDAAALQHFEDQLLGQVDPVVRRVNPSGDFVDEVKQQVRLRLFVPPRPRIEQYRARGSLLGWVRTIAAKTALDLLAEERRGRSSSLDDQAEIADLGEDVDLALLQRRYGAVFRQAFDSALSELDDQQRAVLRLYLHERRTLADIGAMLKVDRTTIVRWLARSRVAMLARIKAHLIAVVPLAPGEVSTLIRALRRSARLELGDALL